MASFTSNFDQSQPSPTLPAWEAMYLLFPKVYTQTQPQPQQALSSQSQTHLQRSSSSETQPAKTTTTAVARSSAAAASMEKKKTHARSKSLDKPLPPTPLRIPALQLLAFRRRSSQSLNDVIGIYYSTTPVAAATTTQYTPATSITTTPLPSQPRASGTMAVFPPTRPKKRESREIHLMAYHAIHHEVTPPTGAPRGDIHHNQRNQRRSDSSRIRSTANFSLPPIFSSFKRPHNPHSSLCVAELAATPVRRYFGTRPTTAMTTAKNSNNNHNNAGGAVETTVLNRLTRKFMGSSYRC